MGKIVFQERDTVADDVGRVLTVVKVEKDRATGEVVRVVCATETPVDMEGARRKKAKELTPYEPSSLLLVKRPPPEPVKEPAPEVDPADLATPPASAVNP